MVMINIRIADFKSRLSEHLRQVRAASDSVSGRNTNIRTASSGATNKPKRCGEFCAEGWWGEEFIQEIRWRVYRSAWRGVTLGHIECSKHHTKKVEIFQKYFRAADLI